MRVDELIRELLAFRGEARAEAARDAVVGLVRAGGEAALTRGYVTPGHVTASAVVVDGTGERTLLVWHRFLRLWLQPGGHVDAGDVSVRDAALREVREETGLDGVIVGPVVHVDVHAIPANPAKGEPEHQHHDVRWIVRVAAGEARPGDDVGDARWFRWDELSALDTDDSVRALAAATRARLSSASRDPRG